MKRIFLQALIFGCILSACTPAGSSQQTQSLPPDSEANARQLYVFAAASLTKPFDELILAFEHSHPGVRVIPNYAGSQQLAQQIAQGAPADVFASANQNQMEAVIRAGRVQAGSEQIFARNRLVVILPAHNPGKIAALQDLAADGHSLILADEAVPVGGYSLEFLKRASQDPEFQPGYQAAVLENVVSYEGNVKAVLSKVILGEADAGIVYASDVSPADAEKLIVVEIPDPLNIEAAYYLAPVNDSRVPDLAQAFIASVLEPAGQDLLSQDGFLPAP